VRTSSKRYLLFEMIYRSLRDVPSRLNDNESTLTLQRRDLAYLLHFYGLYRDATASMRSRETNSILWSGLQLMDGCY